MQILSLELENAKSFQHARIEFTPGINAIVGHNGAGKSTILEAIGFSLFDSLAYTQADFVREGAKSATITTTFVSSLDDRSYQVVRRCGSSNQHFVHDPETGIRICEGKADVLTFLRQNMGLEPSANLSRLFQDAVGVPQGTLTAAFLLNLSQRKSVFDPLLHVEEYDTAFRRLLAAVNLLRDRRQAVEVEIAGLTGRLERLPVLRDMVAKRRAQIAVSEETRVSVTARLAEAEARRSRLEVARQRLLDLQGQRVQTREQTTSLSRQITAADQARGEAEAAREAVAAHQAGHDLFLAAQNRQRELDARTRARSRVEAACSDLDKQVVLVSRDLANLEREGAEIQEAEATLTRLALAVAEVAQLESALTDARQQAGRLTDAETQRTRLRAQVQSLQGKHASLAAQAAQAGELEAAREQTAAQIEGARDTIDEGAAELARIKVEADATKQQNATLEQAETALCPVCEQPLDPQHRADLLKRNAVRVEQLRSTYKELQDAARSANQQMAELTQEAAKTDKRLRELPRQQEVTALEASIAAASDELATAEERAAELAAAPTEVKTLEEQLAGLSETRNAYAVASERAGRRDAVDTARKEGAERLASIEGQLRELTEQLAAFTGLDAEVEAVAAQTKQHEDAYRIVLSNRQLADSRDERQREVETLRTELAEVEQRMAAVEQQLVDAEAAFDEADYRAVVEQEESLREQRGGLEAQLAMMAQEQQREQAEIGALQQSEADLDRARIQQRDLESQSALLDSVRKVIQQAGPYVTATLIRQISEGAAQIFGDIMQDYSRHLNWNQDYSITLNVDGHDRAFSQLSGGEQMSAALSVRLALLREMSAINVAFFDEPTSNLDETRRESLARQILNVRGFHQLFVISHDDTFEQATQNLIRVERVRGLSVVAYE